MCTTDSRAVQQGGVSACDLTGKSMYLLFGKISGYVAWFSTKFVACPCPLEVFCIILWYPLEMWSILPYTWHCSVLK